MRIGIIGGNFGRIGLLPAFKSIKGCEVVPIGKDWREILQKEKFDALALAVPPNIQYQIAKFAIPKGIHIFAEKPLAPNLKTARELFDLAQKHKTVTALDFIFPEIPEWQKVKEFIDKKTFGTLNNISVEWDWLAGDLKYQKSSWKTDTKKGGGAISFYFSHGFYYLENFAGKIKSVKVIAKHSPKSLNGGEVGFEMLLEFENGISGFVHVSSNTDGVIRHNLTFQFEKGIVILEGKNTITKDFTIKVLTDGKEKILKIKKHKIKNKEDERVFAVKQIAERFVSSIKTRKQLSPSFKDGLRVQELIEKAKKAKSSYS